MSCGGVAVGVQEANHDRIIISALEVVEARLRIVAVAVAAKIGVFLAGEKGADLTGFTKDIREFFALFPRECVPTRDAFPFGKNCFQICCFSSWTNRGATEEPSSIVFSGYRPTKSSTFAAFSIVHLNGSFAYTRFHLSWHYACVVWRFYFILFLFYFICRLCSLIGLRSQVL